MAEERFRDAVASILLELLEDLFHLREHFGAAEFGYDEIIGKKRVTKWTVGIGVWVEEELECEGWVGLGTEERGESER